MKRPIVISLALCLLLTQSIAFAGTGFKAAIDELHYTLLVDGAVLDPLKSEAAHKVFEARIVELMAKGQTRFSLLEEAFDLIKDQKLALEMKEILTALNHQEISSQQAKKLLIEILDSTQTQGANWNGRVLANVVGISVLIAGFIFILAAGPGLCADEVYMAENASACDGSYSDYPIYWD